MGSQIGIIAAFGAGVASFLSPCVLPLIPGYLSFLGGYAASPGTAPSRRDVIVPAALFVVGFSVVFVALGASASALGALLAPYRGLLGRIAGVVVFVFGVLLLGVIRVPWMYRELRFDPAEARGRGVWTAPLMGAAFGFGWTPCVGPILGSILAVAAQGGDVAGASALLLAYSLGLGVPFMLTAVALSWMTPLLRYLTRHARIISIAAGVVLMVLGVAMVTGQIERLAGLVS